MQRLVLSTCFVLVLAGCQRGCLTSWLDARGIGGPPEAPPKAAVPLSGLDCPDGLARCTAGSIEVSRLARIPDPCVGRPSECSCPWEVLAACDSGCVADGVLVDIAPEQAATQLCAPREGELIARPVASATMAADMKAAAGATVGSAPRERVPHTCDEAEYVCVGSTVAACTVEPESAGGAAPRPVAVCVLGCAHEGQTVEDPVTDPQAVALLCRRP